MFSLTFRTDNAAFEDGPASEVGRILREIARKIERGTLEGPAHDHNGNLVGAYFLNGRNPLDHGAAAPLAFTEEEARRVAHHLQTAATRYDDSATDMETGAKAAGATSMQAQAAVIFRDHAAEARAFSNRIEEA